LRGARGRGTRRCSWCWRRVSCASCRPRSTRTGRRPCRACWGSRRGSSSSTRTSSGTMRATVRPRQQHQPHVHRAHGARRHAAARAQHGAPLTASPQRRPRRDRARRPRAALQPRLLQDVVARRAAWVVRTVREYPTPTLQLHAAVILAKCCQFGSYDTHVAVQRVGGLKLLVDLVATFTPEYMLEPHAVVGRE
jgi:hypothetical protein